MGATDKTLRPDAKPFLGAIMGYNRNEQSDADISQADTLGDLLNLSNNGGTPAQNNMVRILRPKFGQIVSAHLTISLTTATAETNPSFKVSVYKVTSSSDLTAVTTPTATIDQQMIRLTGSSTGFSNTAGQPINVDALDILALIPQVGDTDYNEDCFTIGVHFPATPSNGSGYKLRRFQVDLNALVVF